MTQTTEQPKRRFPWTIVAIVGALVLVTAASWWFAGRKVWTDDHGVAIIDGQAKLREVLWSPPKPLGELFEGDQQHYEPSFSPDGTELYFVAGKPGHNADIYVSYRHNNQWSKPEPVSAVNTAYDELGPRVTADGKFLLFYSDRPGGFGGYDIWASPRTKSGWGKPFNLGPNVNSEFNEFTPDATPDGKHLIFATNRTAAKHEQLQPWRATIRENEASDFDLWIAELKEPAAPTDDAASVEVPSTQPAASDLASAPATQPAAPLALAAGSNGATTQPTTAPSFSSEAIPPELAFAPAHEIPGINTPYVEGASCMSPAGDFLYFASNRPGGLGKFDIWRSRVSPDWKFGPVENAGPTINSADNETDPALAFNGYRLIFSSDRGSDTGVYRLFSSDSREVYAMREGRPLPHVGLSFWIFLGCVLALIPLLLMLRTWDSGRLNVLQKCLLIAVLLHVLLLLGMRFKEMSLEVYHFARQQMGVEVAINLNPSPELEVGTSIRRQSTAMDLSTTGAPPRAERISQTPLETAIARGPVDVALPRATASVEPAMAAADVARILPTVKPDMIAAQPVAPKTDVPQNDPLDVHLEAKHVVSQAEVRPQVEVTAAPSARTDSALSPAEAKILPSPAALVAQAKPAALAIEPGPVARPNLPAGGMTAPARVDPNVAPVATSAPNVDIAQTPAAKVAGHEAAPEVSTAAAKSASAGPLDSASAAVVQGPKSAVTPAAAPVRPDASPSNTPSIMTAGAFHPAPGPVVQSAAAPGTSSVVAVPDIDSPKTTNAPIRVAGGQPSAPQVQETSADTARQGVALASATATGVEIPVPRVTSSPVSSIGGPAAPGVASAVKAIMAGPTTLPSESIASAIGAGPTAPQVIVNAPQASGPQAIADRPMSRDGNADQASRATGPIAANSSPVTGGAAQVAASNAPSRPDAGSAVALAPGSVGPIGLPGIFAPPVAGARAAIPGAMDGPQISLPQAAAALVSPHPAAAGSGQNGPEPTVIAMASKQTLHGAEGGGTKNVSIDVPGPIQASARLPKESGSGLDPISSRTHMIEIGSAIAPRVDINPLPSDIGTGKLNAPDSPFQLRSPEMHRPIIEKLGGNKQSEDAVAKALFWLADNQEDNGRWTIVSDNRKNKRNRGVHDTALTGLSVLAFLAQDHRPDKPGPYRDTVIHGLDFLVTAERPDGDLRGDSPGAGAASSNMYDQGIATYAMAEAASVSHDPRYIAAALRAADFIVKAQNDETGGWRYAPRESADTSVFGWQVMALHSAEQVGFVIPDHTREGITHYIQIASSGQHHMLGSYLPHAQPTPTMTAQLAFTRMLLGQQLVEAETSEASDFLSRTPPGSVKYDLYYSYYASLCMSQMQTPAWKQWNEKTRDNLIATQTPEGEHGGYWESNVRKGESAGRVFSTAMAALTLEVYYRYMPLQERNGAPVAPTTPNPERAKAR